MPNEALGTTGDPMAWASTKGHNYHKEHGPWFHSRLNQQATKDTRGHSLNGGRARA